jgi:hypothetical protein
MVNKRIKGTTYRETIKIVLNTIVAFPYLEILFSLK